MVPFEKSAKILEQKKYQLRNLRKFGNKKWYHKRKVQKITKKIGTILEKFQNSVTKKVSFEPCEKI